MNESELDEVVGRPPLRVDLLTPAVRVVAGEPVAVTLEVVNTSEVIDEVVVRLVGVLPESVVQTPEDLTLFPGETVRVSLDLRFHPTLPSGVHEALLVVAGRSGAAVAAELGLTIEVPERSSGKVRVEPPVRTAGKRGSFEVMVDNAGNTELDLLLHATDSNRLLDLSLSQRKFNLRVDQTGYATLVAYHKRPWTGPAVEHVITVGVEAGPLEEATEVRFRQKPVFTAGVITILTLLLIVALWTLAMLFGVRAALSPAEPTKAVPETFMQGTSLQDLDPATVGGTIAGTVTATSNEGPVPRVTIEAFSAAGQLITATATADDGSYELGGLVPARYRLRLRATGFEERWWPSAGDAASAEEVTVRSTSPTVDTDVQMIGLPGGMGGQAVAGDGDPIQINVEVVAIDLAAEQPPVQTSTDESGVWTIEELPAPATYRVTYSAAGYAPVELTQQLAGGEQLVLNAARLPAAPGSISGRVQDRSGIPLGGVEIVAQRGDTELSTTTPTSGEVGAFSLPALETPGTYLLTFSADGLASETQGVRLGPGESVSDLVIVLSSATGTVRGQATSSTGQPLGGVTVTISGGGTVQSADTLTSGSVGSFQASGLPLPGTYTVTFDLEGFARESVQVQLDGENPEGTANVVMTSAVGRIDGIVVDRSTGEPVQGATVEVSDGAQVRSTTTASAPAQQRGRFSVGELLPGSYTVTATAPGGQPFTVLQTVSAAQTVEVRIAVGVP